MLMRNYKQLVLILEEHLVSDRGQRTCFIRKLQGVLMCVYQMFLTSYIVCRFYVRYCVYNKEIHILIHTIYIFEKNRIEKCFKVLLFIDNYLLIMNCCIK